MRMRRIKIRNKMSEVRNRISGSISAEEGEMQISPPVYASRPQDARSAFISNPNARHRSLTEVLLWQLVPLPFEATIIGQPWPDTRRLFWGDCAGFRGASGQPHIPLRDRFPGSGQ